MMKILVTGGAGYIGSHAVHALIEKNYYEVIIVDNLSKGFQSNLHPKAKFYQADVTDEKTLAKVFEAEKDIVAIMHFAGLIVVPESVQEPMKYFHTNTHGVEILLKLATKMKIKYFIFSSTAAVYGEPKHVPILETDLKEPINPYGDSKLAAEAMIRAWAHATEANYIIFRYFNVAGAHENGKIGVKGNNLTHLLPCVINSAITGNTFHIMGNNYPTKDGTCIRDFVHVKDLVMAHILGLEWAMKNHQSNTFNLGSGSGYSVLEVLNKAIEILKIDIPYNIAAPRKGDPDKLFANTKKVTEILKWIPEYSLEKIIESEYFFRKNNK